MECMCAQTKPRYTLYWKELGGGVRAHANSKGKSPVPEKFSPEKDQTHDAASSRTASPTHYHRASLAPIIIIIISSSDDSITIITATTNAACTITNRKRQTMTYAVHSEANHCDNSPDAESSPSSSSAFPGYISRVHHSGEIFLRMRPSLIQTSSWIVHAGRVFVAGIHPSRT